MSFSTFGYQGTVKISTYKRGRLVGIKTVKNEGTHRLFSVLCKALGKVYNTDSCPTYLDVGYMDGSVFHSILLRSDAIFLNVEGVTEGGSLDSTDKCQITYQASITQAFTKEHSDASGPIYIALRDGYTVESNQEGPGLLAYISIPDWTASSWNPAIDEVYLITWTLEIGNALNSTTSSANVLPAYSSVNSTTTKSKVRKVTKNAQ